MIKYEVPSGDTGAQVASGLGAGGGRMSDCLSSSCASYAQSKLQDPHLLIYFSFCFFFFFQFLQRSKPCDYIPPIRTEADAES